VKVSVPFRSATVETCVELVSRSQESVIMSRMQCSICIVIARNASILASFTLGRGEGPSSMVKVAVVVSRSLLHQQCYNFRKTQQESAKQTGAVI